MLEFLSFGPKHQVLGKFDHVESLGQFDKFVVNPVVANGANLTDISHLIELASWYSSNVLERLTSRSFA